jgi:hypothetical protein
MDNNAIVLKNRRKSVACSNAHKRKVMAITRTLKVENLKRYEKAKKLLKKFYGMYEHRLALAREKIIEQRAAHEKILRAQKSRLNKMIEKRDVSAVARRRPYRGVGR